MKVGEEMDVYWGRISLVVGPTYCAATKKGICFIGTPNEPFEQLEEWVQKHLGSVRLLHEVERLDTYAEELKAYFKGEIQIFKSPLDIYGTTFQQVVWRALDRIPYGETTTYSEIAESVGNPKAVRAIGRAIGANPVLYLIPCHRVVPKSGGLGGFRAGVALKGRLLKIEESVGIERWENN